MEILLLKLFCAPALVVAATVAGRRWGASVTGLLVSLPIVAGPILFVTYLQHGSAFASRAAGASLLGLVSLALFAAAFAWSSRRLGWLPTVATCWLATLCADFGLSRLHVTAALALVLTVIATLVALGSMPRSAVAIDPLAAPRWAWWDLPGRAVATGLLVLTITSAAGTLGPDLTGVLAPFPIATSVVAAFVLAQRGATTAAATLSGALTGLFGFAAFFFCVAMLVNQLGGAAFVVALGATVAVQVLAAHARRWQQRAKPATRVGPVTTRVPDQ
ncbi:hypothetical protein ACSMXN_07585 [Jatrophihabitans sp. DSM 45814]